MTKKISKVLNGNVNSFLRIIFIGLLLGLFGFLFNQVSSIPYDFATKGEVSGLANRMDHRLDRIEGKVDDINRFLRK